MSHWGEHVIEACVVPEIGFNWCLFSLGNKSGSRGVAHSVTGKQGDLPCIEPVIGPVMEVVPCDS